MDILNVIFPWIAWAVCILLLSLPGLWGAVFTFSLLGHLSQLVFKKSELHVERK